MTTTPSANDLTRQQLEELDALLQRMLSLPAPAAEPKPREMPNAPAVPLPSLEKLPTTATETWRLDRPTAVPSRPLHVTPPAPAADEVNLLATPEDLEPFRREGPPTSRFAITPVQVEPVEEPLPPSVSNDANVIAPPVPITPSLPYTPPEVPLIPVAELPQFGRIQVADVTTTIEPVPVPEATTTIESPVEASSNGVPVMAWPLFAVNWVAEETLKVFGGESLTRPAAKWTMGLAGMVMIAAAAAWMAHGYGVVTLPIK